MAPEMVELQDKIKASRGYCYMVDYWSLGVLLYVLRVNKMPFGSLKHAKDPAEEYACLQAPLEFPVEAMCSDIIKTLIRNLLEVQESARLGFGLAGFRNFRDHPFFERINWYQLSLGQTKPPLCPILDLDVKIKNWKKYANFDDMITQCIDSDISMLDLVSDRKQNFFKNWFVIYDLLV